MANGYISRAISEGLELLAEAGEAHEAEIIALITANEGIAQAFVTKFMNSAIEQADEAIPAPLRTLLNPFEKTAEARVDAYVAYVFAKFGNPKAVVDFIFAQMHAEAMKISP